jgi:isorenieratene synthase
MRSRRTNGVKTTPGTTPFLRRIIPIGRPLPPLPDTRPAELSGPDWVQANPVRIAQALRHTLAKPHGNWFVLGASRRVRRAPTRHVVAGETLVVWRGADGVVRTGPDTCPHMGAELSCGRVEGDQVVCPWHGLALGDAPHGAWQPLATHDDGVLAWVRIGTPDPQVPAPILPERPSRFLDALVTMEARCEPADVIANRLDPWHGTHLHPHAFARLCVLSASVERLVVRVAVRVLGPWCVEVDASFHCPEPRTIVMTIVAGDGAGSVVETHATPVGPGRTRVVEATLATSDRPGFGAALRAAGMLRPLVKHQARGLLVADCAYAERLCALRQRAESRERRDEGR